jgi:hypothetical protein
MPPQHLIGHYRLPDGIIVSIVFIFKVSYKNIKTIYESNVRKCKYKTKNSEFTERSEFQEVNAAPLE